MLFKCYCWCYYFLNYLIICKSFLVLPGIKWSMQIHEKILEVEYWEEEETYSVHVQVLKLVQFTPFLCLSSTHSSEIWFQGGFGGWRVVSLLDWLFCGLGTGHGHEKISGKCFGLLPRLLLINFGVWTVCNWLNPLSHPPLFLLWWSKHAVLP